MPNIVSSSSPLYSLPSGVKSPRSLLYSGNPPPSPASPPPYYYNYRLEPIPTYPCYSLILRLTLTRRSLNVIFYIVSISAKHSITSKRKSHVILSLFKGAHERVDIDLEDRLVYYV